MALNELGLMYPIILQSVQAKVIKLFYFDGCGHTDSHNHTYMCRQPSSYLSHHTPLLTPKHTNTPPDWAGSEEGSQYLRS